jgi:dTMP kinase
MRDRGKFIVLEGIDGSGKRTQLEMLARAFSGRGIPCAQISFPRYDGFFGQLVARFLNGEFGPLEAVDPHFSALLYAGDRLEAKPEIEAHLAAGRTVLSDRYIGSNLAHQGARVGRAKRNAFLEWLSRLEYEIYALPAEDLVIYLRVPPTVARGLVAKKGARGYTKKKRDLQEASLAHLEAAASVYDHLAHRPMWRTVECAAVNGSAESNATHTRAQKRSHKRVGASRLHGSQPRALRSPEEIHKEVLAAVETCLPFSRQANA